MQNRIYGIVEGFFSDPIRQRNQKQRLQTLQYIGEKCKDINAYIFCPKNNIYVAQKPYTLYTAKKAKEFRNYTDLCKKHKIQFIYGINPKLGEKELLEEDKTIKKIIRKFMQMKSSGCDSFCLLFDDIPIAYDVFCKNREIDSLISKKIIEIVNGVYDIIKNDCKIFLFCGPDYCFKTKNAFTNELGGLHSDIYIFWTGNNVFTNNIVKANINKVKKITGNKKIAIWKNYPVNDLQQNTGMFNLGGYKPFDEEKNSDIPIFINPMREFGASFGHFKTFSDYIQDPSKYNSDKNMTNTIMSLLDVDNKIAQTIKLIAQFDIYDNQEKIRDILPLIRQKNILNTVKNIKPSTKWGKIFFHSINTLTKQISYLADIIDKITRESKINKTSLQRDVFPTTSANPRYFTEIYDIIAKRSSLGYFSPRGLSQLSYFKTYKKAFLQRYAGSKGLKNIDEYKERYVRLSKNIIDLDQKQLIIFLNDENMSKKERIEVFIKRFYINRFYIGILD